MGLLSSIFKRQAAASPRAAAGVSESVDEVQRARTRARQRLIGAAVLLGIGVVGFPLVFETQPRPIPVNIPIELPRKEGAPPLTMPAARPPAATSPAPAAPAPAPASATPATPSRPAPAASSAIITESREDAGREVAASAPSVARAASKPAPKPVEAKVAEPKPAEPKPVEAKTAEPKPAAKPSDSARARALLEGQNETAADAGRFVVQVGAFADVAAARETRLKVEKLGLKTYTQVAETSAGKRIRVRAGPFTSRADADKALAKARAAGLTAVVLTL